MQRPNSTAASRPPENGAPPSEDKPQKGTFSLQRKVLLAISCLLVMVGICGAVGLVFFERIAASVSTLATVSSPLLIESMALERNADRMQSVLSDADPSTEGIGAQVAALDRLEREARRHTDRLKDLSAGTGLLSQFELVEQLRHEFATTLREIVAVRARKEAAEETLSGVYAKVHTVISLAMDQAFDIGRRWSADGTSSPNSQMADALARQIAHAHEIAALGSSVVGEIDLERLGENFEHFWSRASGSLERLNKTMLLPLDQKALADIEASLVTLRENFAGPEGLLAEKSELLVTTAIFSARSKKLDEIETRYREILSGIAMAVHQQNVQSRAQTSGTIAQGREAIVALLAGSTLLAIGAAVFLILSISRPLQSLRAHVQRIGRQAMPIAISDTALLRSTDELGDLARAFNGMIRELGEARQQLIAKSDAEITRQVDRLEAAVNNMSQGLCMFDQDKRLIISNDRYAEIYGIAPERIWPGITLREVLEMRLETDGYFGDRATYVSRRLAASGAISRSHYVAELQNGRIVQIVDTPLKNGGWVSTHEDITERRQIEARIVHMAHHDGLTDLPNRVLFRQRLEEGLARAARGERLAVLALDLDRFKLVNDTLGHAVGDALLKAVSARLLSCVREVDTVARLGGDEFAIIQVDIDVPQQAVALAQRVVTALCEPFTVNGHQIDIGTSIGIAFAPHDGETEEVLLQKADLALYRAKADGRGNYRFFETGMDAQMQQRRSLEADLRGALAKGQLELFYQPLIDLKSNRITGFETLLRWRHPQRGLLLPANFIPLAEEAGLIVPIGEWALHQACREAASWPEGVRVSVNLSPTQFKSRNLTSAVSLALSNSGLRPDRLELEITETVLFHDNEATLAVLLQLKALGVRIVIDDFGTGYSALAYLRNFPFDKIKIDRSFVQDLTEREDCAAIVRAVMGLGASLGIQTTAEGVETVEQMEKLRLEGCGEIQGFLLSPPRSAAEIAPLIADLREAAA